MKIALFSDVHANLPALRAIFADLRREGCDAAFHTGDAAGIGPFPAEVLEELESFRGLRCVMGNHDAWLLKGPHAEAPPWLVSHCRWSRSRVARGHLEIAARWPLLEEHEFEGVKAAFVHYALSPCGGAVAAETGGAVPEDLDGLLKHHSSAIVFHGHRHNPSDTRGRVRYVNPGSLGCWHTPAARYALIRFHKGRAQVRHRTVPYDQAPLYEAFARCGMPDWQQIVAAYFGKR